MEPRRDKQALLGRLLSAVSGHCDSRAPWLPAKQGLTWNESHPWLGLRVATWEELPVPPPRGPAAGGVWLGRRHDSHCLEG